jgi:AhpD family alkylhydroperoxidase
MTRTKLIALCPLLFSLTVPTAALAAPSPADAARADMKKTLGFVPDFVRNMPEAVLPGLWSQVKNFETPDTALSAKDKKLIGLAVASQAGNKATVYSYSRCARAAGASQAELGEAVAIAALVRQFSAVLNGLQTDEAKFRAEIAQAVAHITRAASAGGAPPAPLSVTDARSARADIKQAFGSVPQFLDRMPDEALPGAWLALRELELSPRTALPGKTKTLISVAVASQVPCRYCVIADSEFARLEGATSREISEAVTMAGMARNFAALLDGLQVDEAAFRRDFARMTPGADRTTRMARKASDR